MKVRVTLFKRSGKYYTEEEWRIPEGHRYDFSPTCMKDSPDFHRIGDGPVLIDTQEPWGFPHLLM